MIHAITLIKRRLKLKLINNFKTRVAANLGILKSESFLDSTLNVVNTAKLLGNASLILTPNAIKESKVYSIIPGNGNGDMTVVRATTATIVNSEGFIEEVPYNLARFSEMFADALWFKTNSSVTPNVIAAPNGSLTADLLSRNSTTLSSYTNQPMQSSKSNVYTGTIYAKLGTVSTNFGLRVVGVHPDRGDAVFNISTGVLIGTANGGTNTGTSGTITNMGNGWYKLTITTTFSTIPTGVQILMGATALSTIGGWEAADGALSNAYVWGAQLVQGSVQKDYFPTTDRLNVPRLNYDVAGGCPSILLEPQRTNFVLNSGNAPQALPNLSTYTLDSSVVTPANTNNAYKFIPSVLNASISGASSPPENRLWFQIYNINTTYTNSVYVKSVDGESFNLAIKVVNCATDEQIATKTILVTNQWQRVSATGLTNGTQPGVRLVIRSEQAVYLWGFQIEQGAYPTSYIPTLSSTVTRNADVITRNNIYTNGLITSAGGTWFIELNNNIPLTRDVIGSEFYIGESNAGFNVVGFKAISIRNNGGASTRMGVAYWDGFVSNVLFTTTQDNVKLAIVFNGTTMNIFQNGVKVLSDLSIPLTLSNMTFFNCLLGVSRSMKSTLLFPTPLTDAQCISLTSFTNYPSYENMAINLNYVIQ